jgi:hypothetical protein
MDRSEIFILGIVAYILVRIIIWFEWWLRKKLYPSSAIEWLMKELKSLGGSNEKR